jgi:hypothetical protein
MFSRVAGMNARTDAHPHVGQRVGHAAIGARYSRPNARATAW